MHPGGGNTAGFFETGRLATRGGPSGDTTETTMPTMKTTLALPAATCDAAFLLGGCQHTHSHQDLNGAWRGTGHTINSAGRSETNKYLDLEVDENGLIEGVAGWRLLEGAGGHDQKHRDEGRLGRLNPRPRPELRHDHDDVGDGEHQSDHEEQRGWQKRNRTGPDGGAFTPQDRHH